MTLSQIEYFLALAKHQNFTSAAQSLYITQPHLSKQIASLENEIGVRLFERSNRGVKLTEPGEALKNGLSGIPDQVERAVVLARAAGREQTGRLSLGVLAGQNMESAVSERLLAFRGMNPGITLEMSRQSFRALRMGLINGKYDLIITLDFDLRGMELAHRTILKSKNALVLSRKHHLAGMEGLTVEMLAEEDFVSISPEESDNGYMGFMRRCRSYGFEPRVVQFADSLEDLMLCVEAGLGIAILDRNTRLERAENVCVVSLDEDGDVGLEAAWLPGNRNPSLKALVGALTGPDDE